MRLFKPMYVIAVAGITLASCGSVKNMTVPTMDTAVSATAKTGTINEEDFNHWAHADLVTDSIPGMSLDKAYKFLEGKTVKFGDEFVVDGLVWNSERPAMASERINDARAGDDCRSRIVTSSFRTGKKH